VEVVIANLGRNTLDYEKVDVSKMPKYGTLVSKIPSETDFSEAVWLVRMEVCDLDDILDFCEKYDTEEFRVKNREIPKFYIAARDLPGAEPGYILKFTSYSERKIGETPHYTQYFRD
jgi:hypothetical protein